MILAFIPYDSSIVLTSDILTGNAEQIISTMSSISELKARLQLWAFKMDYDNLEQEVSEPLADLKKGIDDLKLNKTFKWVEG